VRIGLLVPTFRCDVLTVPNIDRATTSCLLCYLSSAYPQHALIFQFLIALDFSSHYMHMYRYISQLSPPTRTRQSHLSTQFVSDRFKISQAGNLRRQPYPLVLLQRSSACFPPPDLITISHRDRCQTTLFLICAGNELFFVALYLAHWVHTPISLSIVAVLPILKGLTWPELIALVCFPVSALKNVINIVQLWKASKILVGVDLVERAKAREAAKHDSA
jgi:CDP-diacylglycerol--inositol 3-phosphatidyltransferase